MIYLILTIAAITIIYYISKNQQTKDDTLKKFVCISSMKNLFTGDIHTLDEWRSIAIALAKTEQKQYFKNVNEERLLGLIFTQLDIDLQEV